MRFHHNQSIGVAEYARQIISLAGLDADLSNNNRVRKYLVIKLKKIILIIENYNNGSINIFLDKILVTGEASFIGSHFLNAKLS